ncbi:MAG: cell division protein FtsL [Legionellales bacterium]|nr:cell division protein FtsL [Legionellales bacterium]
MNATTRAYSQSTYALQQTRQQFWTLSSFVSVLLAVLVFLSAFSIVYVRDYERQMITELQGMQITYDAMLTQRSQLLLEQAAFSTQTRIQDVAVQKLGMAFPEQEAVITLG